MQSQPIEYGDEPALPSNRSIGFVFTGFFAIVAAAMWYSGHGWLWAVAASATFLAVALIHPSMLGPLNRTVGLGTARQTQISLRYLF